MIENQEIVNPVAMMQTLNNNKDWDKFVGSVWGELEVFENLTFKTSLFTDMAFGAKGIGSLLVICVIWSRMRNRGWSKR